MTEETSGYQLFPEGKYVLKVSARPEKFKAGQNAHRYLFKFFGKVADSETENLTLRYSQNFFSWDIEPLLIAMGFKRNEQGKIKWELEDVVGKIVQAEISHEPDRNDSSKKWARMKNITEYIPF